MNSSTEKSTIAEISAYFANLNLSIFTDPEMISKLKQRFDEATKNEDFAREKYAEKLAKEEARLFAEFQEARRFAEFQEARRFAEAQEEARRFVEAQEARRFAEAQEAMRFAEAQEEARRFVEAQEEARQYEKANRFYSKNREPLRIKLPSQGRKTPSPPPPTPNVTNVSDINRQRHYQQRPRSNSPPQFFYNNGMMHIINQ